jgi:hypothetical protein
MTLCFLGKSIELQFVTYKLYEQGIHSMQPYVFPCNMHANYV